MIVDDCMRTYKRFCKMDEEFESFEKKNKSTLLRLEQRIDVESETLQKTIEKTEKSMVNMFNKLRIDVENLLQRSHHKVEIVSNDLNETISRVHEKLRKVDDTSSVKDWVQMIIDQKTEVLIKNTQRFDEIEDMIKQQKNDQLRIVSNLQKTFAGKYEDMENMQSDLKFSVHQSQQYLNESIENFSKKIEEHEKLYELIEVKTREEIMEVIKNNKNEDNTFLNVEFQKINDKVDTIDKRINQHDNSTKQLSELFESGGSKQDVQKFMNDLNCKIDEITQRVENIEEFTEEKIVQRDSPRSRKVSGNRLSRESNKSAKSSKKETENGDGNGNESKEQNENIEESQYDATIESKESHLKPARRTTKKLQNVSIESRIDMLEKMFLTFK